MKSEFGKIVSRKKEELNEIINLFSIQIENPICILSQEVSRNFLNSKNPRDKYEFFMKGTGLEQLRQAYAVAMEESVHAKETLIKKKSFLPSIENEVKELEKKVDIFTKFNKKKDQLNILICELLWSFVRKLEIEELQPPKQIEDLDKKIADCNERYETLKEENLELERLKEEFSSSIQTEYEVEMRKLVDKKNNLSLRLEELRKSKMEKQFKVNEINFSLDTNNKDKEQLEKKIKNIKLQIEQQEILMAEQERIKAKRTELINEQEEIKLKIKNLRDNKDYKQEEYTKLSDSIKSLSYRLNKTSSELSNKNNLLGNLKGGSKDNLAKFGSHFVRIVKLIEEENRKGKFKKKPLGPLGNYIKLKDDNIATALEACLKGLMHAFVCDNYQDAEYLLKLIKQVNPPRIPMVLRRKFCSRFSIGNQVKLDRYKSFLSYITIENDQVFNIIMDKSNLDQTLYIPSDKTAVELLTNENIVPQNLKLAYSQLGTQFYPKKFNSNFRQYSNNRKATGILSTDTEDLIKKLEIEIEDLKNSTKDLNAEKEDLNKNCKSILDEIKKLDKETDTFHAKLNNLSRELYELQNVKEFKPEDLTLFETEYQGCINSIQKFKEKIKELQEEELEIDEKYRIVKQDQKECDEEMIEKKEKFKIMESKVRENDFLSKKGIETMDKIVKRIEEFNLRKELIMNKLTEIKLKKEVAINTAKERHEEKIETEREPNEIQQEMDELNAFIQENENRLGNREELCATYREKKTHYEKMKDQIEFLERYVNQFTESIRSRATIYCHLRNRITTDTSKNFTRNLKILNYTGSLEIYHKDAMINGKLKKGRSLDIKINPKSSDPNQMYNDTRSLSGGERSFSTIAFLIALWESSYSPFNVLDEVDVFMDMVTRHLALDLLIETANKKQGKQYIFLSPLPPEKTGINNLLKIFYMPEPRRVEQQNED